MLNLSLTKVKLKFINCKTNFSHLQSKEIHYTVHIFTGASMNYE